MPHREYRILAKKGISYQLNCWMHEIKLPFRFLVLKELMLKSLVIVVEQC